jgi:hypothetical protein
MAKKEVIRDTDGNRVTKSGKVDQRSIQSKENLQKAKQALSTYKKQIAHSNSNVEHSTIEEDEDESESDDDEFEIQPVVKAKPEPKEDGVADAKQPKEDGVADAKQPKPEPKEDGVADAKQPKEEPKPAPVEKVKFVNDIEDKTTKWLEQQRELQRVHLEEVNRLKEENKKLKGLNSYNDHLSRISHLAKNVSIKF